MRWWIAAGFLVGSFSLISTANAKRSKLLVSQGTMSLSGSFAMRVDTVIPDRGDSHSGFQLEVSPSFGIFVVDSLQLRLSSAITIPFGTLYENNPKNIGFSAGLRYVFNLGGPVLPYIGFSFGPNFIVPDQGDTLTYMSLGFPVGILLALNPHVALSFGVHPGFDFGIGDARGTIIRVPMGLIGAEAFF